MFSIGFVGELALLVVLRLNEVRKIKSNLSSKVYAFLDHPYSVIVAFILMAIGIYFLTYIPDMLAGRSFFDVINLQGQMYIYQSTLTATHPFASPWYSWPFLIDPVNAIKNMLSSAPQSSLNWVHVPVWLQSASMSNGLNSTIVVMGNPAIWWVGFAAILGINGFLCAKNFQKNIQLEKVPAGYLFSCCFLLPMATIYIHQ